MPAVGLPDPPVPHTTMPRSFAAFDVDRSVAHSGGDQQSQIGQRLDHLARKARALAHRADDLKALQRLGDLSRRDPTGRTP